MKKLGLLTLILGLMASAASAESNFGTVSVLTSATKVRDFKSSRKGLVWYNTSGSATIYCGPTSAVATTTGLPILPSTGYETTTESGGFRGDVWCISGSGTVDVRYWEWDR